MIQPWFCLMGPTAIGKTDLACELLQHFPFEIISVDSAMIYREMNIGSAKPDATVLAQAPHHLIDILSPEDSYSAAQACQDIVRCAQEIEARGRIPLLVGGTMLYFRALQQGLSTLPTADPEIRTNLLRQAKKEGWHVLYQQLSAVDPDAALRIHAHDTQRIIRALEVYLLTQQPLSIWQQTSQAPIDRQFINLILMPAERAQLHDRIALRFKTMLQQGFIQELQYLRQRYTLTAAHPAMRCVGYRQVWDYLTTHQDLTLLTDKGIAATRQLAKRQMTWLRHWPDARIFAIADSTNFREVIAFVRQITDNGLAKNRDKHHD